MEKKLISLIGSIISLIFISLLLIPGSPAFLGKESLIALVIWILLGFGFYLFKRKEYNSIPEKKVSIFNFRRTINRKTIMLLKEAGTKDIIHK